MTDINFARDGKVGDKVHDMMLGNGVIINITPSNKYSIICSFSGEHVSYTHEGNLYLNDKIAILCWGHRETLDQGKPPERFDYPLVMALSNSSLIVEFTDIKTATVLVASLGSDPVGVIRNTYTEHTDKRYWKPCERPAWKPDKPTWCYVSGSSRVILIYTGSARGLYEDSQGCRWTEAEPCAPNDIPDWWPNEWV